MSDLIDDKNNNIIIETPCKHYYHEECISEWFKKYSNKCPTCRSVCGHGIPNL